MERPVDIHIHTAMRAVSQALQLDKKENNKAAYVQYLRSVQFLVQTLIEDAHKNDVSIATNTKKFVKLGVQCMDRVGELAETLESGAQTQPFKPAVVSLTHPVSVTSPGASAPVVVPPSKPTPVKPKSLPAAKHYSRPYNGSELGPLQLAQKQNQQLMAAYKARMGKIAVNSPNKTNLSLSLQRRLAENMAVARARQAALEKKIAERQLRLEAEAARRFASTTGMSADEQERRQIYTKILEYEHDTKWLLSWREQLKLHMDDTALHQELIHKILETNEHPLTQLLGRYQYAIYDKLNPLVTQHLRSVQSISVPYNGPLPSHESLHHRPSRDKLQSISPDTAFPVSPQNTLHDDPAKQDHEHESDLTESTSQTSFGECSDTESAPLYNFAEVYDQTRRDLQEATIRGENLSKKLMDEKESAKEEVYDVTSFDDLFDDDDQNDESEKENIMSKVTNTDSKINILTGERKDSGEDEQINRLEVSALQRHLANIIAQVREYLEKLQAMFIIAYETLDSAAGRDLCNSCLEEPFFKPIWPYLLSLFRITNQNEERCAAHVMTKGQVHDPSDLKVAKKFCPDPSLVQSIHKYPYEPAVCELQQVAVLVCPLSKLECVVRVCRVIVHCVEDYFSHQSSDTDAKAPNLGADDLLPIIAYVIVRSKLPQLVSECQAMEEFVHEGYLMGEEGYCLTSLQTALGYVISLANEDIKDQHTS